MIFNESGFNKDSIFGSLLQGGKTGAIVDVIDELSFNDAEVELGKFNSTLQNTGMTVADYFDQYEAGTPLLREFVESTDESGRSAANYVEFVKQERAAQIANNAAVEQGTVAYKALGVAKKFAAGILNAGIMMAATWAIQKVVEAIDNYIHRYEIAIDKMNEAKDRIKSVNDSLSENTAYVNANMEAYLKLRECINSVNNENISLSDEEYKEFLDLNKEFANMFPELIKGFDDQGTAILNLGTNADVSRQKLADLLEQQQRNADYQVYQELGAMYGGVEANLAYLKEAQNEFEETKKRANDFTEAVEQLSKVDFDAMTIDFGDNLSVDAFSALYNGVGDFYNQLGNEGRSAMYQNSEGLISGVDDLIHYQYDEFTQTYSVFLTNLDKLDEDTKAALINSIKDDTANMVSEYGDIVGNASSEMLDKQNSYNAAWLDYIGALAQGMRSQASFSALDPAVQDFAYNFVSSIDSSIMDQMENGQEFDYTYVRDNILSRLKDIPPEKALKFSELLSGEVDYDQFIQIYNELVEFFRQNGIDVPLNFIYDQSLNGRFSKSISDISMSGRSAGSVSQENEERKLTEYTTQNVTTDEQREQWIEYTRGAKDAAEAIRLYEEGVRSAAEGTEELNGKLSMSEDELSNALSKIGVSTDTFNQYKEDLKAIYPELARDEEAAKRYALSNQQIAAATNDLSSNLEGYLDTINAVTDTENDANRASVEYMNALRSVADDLSNLFGREFTLDEAETFIRNAENANQLKAAIEGDTAAFNALQQQLAEPVIAQIMADAEINIDDFNAQYSAFCDWLNGLAPGTILTNADLNANPFFQKLQEMYQQGKLTAEQISQLFGSLGYDVDFDWEEITPQYTGGGLSSADALAEKFAQKQIEMGKIKLPTNIHYIQKNQTPSAKAPPSGGSSGGGGGSSGGGGGSNSNPLNDAADAVTDAADAVEDAVQSAADAAMKAFNEIKSIWDKWISDQQHNHQMTGYRKQLADLQGKSLNDSSIPYGNYWELTLAELDGLAFSYNGMANSLTAKMNESLASGAIQAGSKEHQEMESSIQQAYQNQFQAMVEYQELLAKREEDRTSIIEKIADRFGKIVENLGKTVSRMWSWWNKNWAVNKQIAAVEKEREKQENVEKRYNKDLKRIGLESKYARAIKNDTLNVNKIQDGFVLERIQKYQDLYDKIRECQEAQKELYEQERELIKSKLSNIVEYFDNIQKYYDSVTGKLDSLKTVKDAAGQKRSLTDILDQYAARTDSYNNAAKAQWTYQTGIDENNTRSMGEIQKDLAVDEIYDSEYYQSIKERNDKLKQQESDYQDKLEEIAELREELANATSKKEKSRIKKEIKTAKKEAKALKLTSGQKKTLKSTDQTLTGAQYVTGAAGMEDTYASAMYQQLLKQIGQLESKKKLSKKEQKTLQMYHDELDALNEGVLVGNVATFRTKFEQLWKLDHSGKALTKAQEQTKAALEKSLDNIKQGYLDYISALDKELSDRMVLDGQSEADLEANYKKTREDTEKSFDEEMKDLTDQSGTATVKNLQANIDKWNDWLSKGKNSKGKKLTSKQKKELENKILAAQAKLEKLAQVPVENVARASSIYDWLEKNRSKYDNNKLSKKDREKWDRLTAELNGYITKQNNAVEELEKERADALEELDNNYETQLNELEEQKNQRLAETYEWAKQAAEYAIETANSTIEMLSDYINQYKSVVELLKDVDLNTLKKYGITDLLGLDGNSDVTDLLRDQLLGGIDAASRKVQESVKKGELLKKLINAGYGGDFEEVLLANSAGLDSSYIQTLRDIAAQLVEGGYSHESWIEEWEKQLADLTGDLVSTTKEVQDFKDQLREDVLFKATDNALASVNRLKNQLSSMQSIIRDDWTTDVNGMTTYGAAKVNEYAQSWKAAQDAVGLYAQRLREIDAAQANPEEYGYASEQDWLNARNEAIQNYYAAVQEGESAAQAIYEIGKKAREAEINQLKKVVESYKAANRSKKELYEYDKQHKASQKTVDDLKAQVEALNGVKRILPFLFNCWEILKLYKLQRSDEISASVNVKNYKNIWIISSEALMRGTFNDYPR